MSRRSNSGKHGGRRSNSGPKCQNQRLGEPVARMQRIEAFFSNPPVQAAEPVAPPETQVHQTNGPSTAAQDVDGTADQETDTAVGQITNADLRLPNYNAEEYHSGNEAEEKGKNVKESINLHKQKKRILTEIYYGASSEAIKKKGQFWVHKPTRVVNTLNPIQNCWIDFFQLRVFNWIPSAVLGGDWKPNCPTCQNKCKQNGHKHPPRLVFDAHENYWLNAPEVYQCSTCTKAKSDGKKNFLSTDSEIMKQIGLSDPELLEIFPCHLSHKNAIDKKLMEIILHCAVKGIGPAAMAQSIESWHELQWQKQENQWAAYVKRRLSQPTLNQHVSHREDIEKCPSYFSSRLGGCVPSEQWLLTMFCTVVERRRNYYDSECIKRALSSTILAIDASYKVPKWLMKWGGEKIYEALHSGTNEYNEIIIQRFSTSDNHEELRSNCEALCRMGLNPHLVFSDNPERDESLMKEVFSNLRRSEDDVMVIEDETPPDLQEVVARGRILYLYELNNALDALARFRQDVDEAIIAGENDNVRICFDAGQF